MLKEKVKLYPGVTTRQAEAVASLERGSLATPEQGEPSRFGDANQVQPIV